jgi:hypothetical protein
MGTESSLHSSMHGAKQPGRSRLNDEDEAMRHAFEKTAQDNDDGYAAHIGGSFAGNHKKHDADSDLQHHGEGDGFDRSNFRAPGQTEDVYAARTRAALFARAKGINGGKDDSFISRAFSGQTPEVGVYLCVCVCVCVCVCMHVSV